MSLLLELDEDEAADAEANGVALSRLDGYGPRLWIDEDELRGFVEGVHGDEGGPLDAAIKKILKKARTP